MTRLAGAKGVLPSFPFRCYSEAAVQAEDEVTAIDLVLEGEGQEISSETRDAYISENERRDPRPHA